VVGGLVEDQQVNGFEEEADHGQAGAFASREDGHLFVDVFAGEEERPQEVADFGADVAHGHPVDGLEDRQGGVEAFGLVLGEITYFDVMAGAGRAVVGDFPQDDAGQGSFPLAVAAHEGHLLPSFNGEVDVVEDQVAAIALGDRPAFDDHLSGAWCRREADVKGCVVFGLDLDAVDAVEGFHA
jgi:hypothetical protein